jgi:hypothetical protein
MSSSVDCRTAPISRNDQDGEIAGVANGALRHQLNFALIERVQPQRLRRWFLRLGQQFFARRHGKYP